MDILEFNKKFLKHTDHTGRFMVKSVKTGCAYYVEPLDGGERRKFGDVDPATKETTGKYGEKYKGAIHPRESLITEENGLKNITILPAGVSPHAYINMIDEQKYEAMQAAKV